MEQARSYPDVDPLLTSGDVDPLVPFEQRTEPLLRCFASAKVYRHPGGHMVPTATGDFKAALLEFLDEAGRPPAVEAQ